MTRRKWLALVAAWLIGSGFVSTDVAWGQLRRRQQTPPTPQAAIPATPAAPTIEPLQTAGDRPIDIQHIFLNLRVDLPKKTVDSQATIRFRTLRRISSVTLDAMEFEVTKVTLTPEGEDAIPASFKKSLR